MEMYLKYEQNKKDYEETMKIYIESINKIEKRKKLYTKERRTIYKVIQPYFLRKLTSFRMIL